MAFVQSSYIPWKGYFDLVNSVDLFVFLDDVQFTVRDWRNRNRIKTPRGAAWITVPCGGDRRRLICEVVLRDPAWQRKHRDLLQVNYRAAPHFAACRPLLDEFYVERRWTSLSEMNQWMTRTIARDLLGIRTEFVDARRFACTGRKLGRILELLDRIGGVGEYLSGPSAREYLVAEEFEKRGIRLSFMDYSGYPEYPQLYSPPFIHEVSVLDLILNTGPRAPEYMKSFSRP